MGLRELKKSDEGNANGASKYCRITKNDMEEFFADLGMGFEYSDSAPGREIVFETDELLPDEPFVTLRVFTSLEKKTGVSREKGADAIRTVVWHSMKNRPIGGRTKTLRIQTWRKNLRSKIQSLFKETEDYVHKCEECGGWMVEKSGKYGDFLGCLNYPSCDNTENV